MGCVRTVAVISGTEISETPVFWCTKPGREFEHGIIIISLIVEKLFLSTNL